MSEPFRLAVTSDLHCGLTPLDTIRQLAGRIAAQQPDLLLIAGDLGEPEDNFSTALNLMGEVPGPKAVVPGNHDVWAGRYGSWDLYAEVLPRLAKAKGYQWLIEEPFRHERLAVAGTIGWYDYSAAGPGLGKTPGQLAALKGTVNNDAHYINWEYSDLEVERGARLWLQAQLQALVEEAPERPLVVVSHVAAFEELVLRKPDDPRWNLSNAYFGNLTLGKMLLEVPQVKLFVCGHTHYAKRATIRRSRANGGPIEALSLGSQYRAPAFEIIEL